jgi:predicted Zn-dependent peptidase
MPLLAQVRPQAFSLSNGLRGVLLEDHEHPLLRVRLDLQGKEGEGLDPAVVATCLEALRRTDTADLKAPELERLLEESGIQLEARPEARGASWRMLCRSRDQDRAMGLLADRLTRSLLPAPPAQPELRDFGARLLRPDRAILVLYGDLGLEQAKRLVMLTLGTWSNPATPPPGGPSQTAIPAPRRTPVPGARLHIRARADLAGLPAEAAALLRLLVPGDPVLAPLRMAVEGQEGWMSLDGEAGSGARTWGLFRQRLEALRERGFRQEDLDRARVAWAAGRSLEALHPEALMASALAEARGRGLNETRMKALTLDQLNGALKAWLDPARLQVDATGDPEDLKALP